MCARNQEVWVKQDALSEVGNLSSALLRVFSGIVPPQLHVPSAFQGDAAGRLYVDDPAAPRAACLLAGEGCYLAGRSSDHRFFRAVNGLLPRDRLTAVFVGRDVAAADVALAVDGLYMLPARRRVAFLSHSPEGASPVPAGILMQAVDRLLLDGDQVGAEDVREDVMEEWQTVERFLERGFGTVALLDGHVIAHSLADYVVGERCEIGVHVDSEHRRQGIGTAVAAATAREAFARGLQTIAWHSWANNQGSIAISRRLGFSGETFYDVLFNHWAAENWSDMSQDEFRVFGEEYERRFGENPPMRSGYPYIVAATAFAGARRRAACLRNLHRAVDIGWLRSRSQLRELWPELFCDPTLPERVSEWGKLFARLQP